MISSGISPVSRKKQPQYQQIGSEKNLRRRLPAEIANQVSGERHQGHEHEDENVYPEQPGIRMFYLMKLLVMDNPEYCQENEAQSVVKKSMCLVEKQIMQFDIR